MLSPRIWDSTGISCSEHHYSGNRLTPNPAVMAAAVSQRCKKVRIALLGQLWRITIPSELPKRLGCWTT